MTTHFLDWKKLLIPGAAAIRADRRAIQIPIEACGFDRRGRFFTERTETLNVSDTGCKFRVRTELACDAVVAVRVLNDTSDGTPPLRSVLFRIVRTEPNVAEWSVAGSQLQQDDPWSDSMFAVEGQKWRRFD